MKKALIGKIIGITLVAVSTLSVAVASLAWFSGAGGETQKHIDGEIGLRGYFYAGDGKTEETAFEIVYPRHLVNLARLQSLGLFTNQTYFQIGHDVSDDPLVHDYKCKNSLDAWVDELDMSPLCYAQTPTYLQPIGNEATPFIGYFRGNGIPIRNVRFAGNPEDIGFFGYVSHEGVVDGLVCDNIEITSLGYNSSITSDYDLFGPDIGLSGNDLADLNDITTRFATNTNLILHNNNPDANYGEQSTVSLRKKNTANGTAIHEINSNDKLMKGFDYNSQPITTTYFDGYLEPVYPSEDVEFKYEWKSSSPIIKEVSERASYRDIQEQIHYYNHVDINGDGQYTGKFLVIDQQALRDSLDFNSGDEVQFDVRLSLYAYYKNQNNITFSRVIQTYLFEFFSNSTVYNDGGYSVNIYLDYESGQNSDNPTNYHHGNNIGFLVGHLNGGLTNSYVYGGKMIVNPDNGNVKIATESDTGLVGEIGSNVANKTDPNAGIVVKGATGYMNLTRIYNGIRKDAVPGATIKGGSNTAPAANYVTYTPYIHKSEYDDPENAHYDEYEGKSLFDLYKNYLSYYPGDTGDALTHYITQDVTGHGTNRWIDYTIPSQYKDLRQINSVHFMSNKIIQDEIDRTGKTKPNGNRGLGVFKIVTPYNSSLADGATYGEHAYDDWGQSMIYNYANNQKTEVYLSTAEFQHTNNGNPNWSAFRASSIPTKFDRNSFEYPFSKNYNYVYRINLAENTDEILTDSKGNKRYFMYNTNSNFLGYYLSSVLINKEGQRIEYNEDPTKSSPKFGVNFSVDIDTDDDGEADSVERVTQLSSYMTVRNIGVDSKRQYTEYHQFNGTEWVRSETEPNTGARKGNINDVRELPATGDLYDWYEYTSYHPTNCVTFRIANSNGANVLVVGNGSSDICIYKYDSTVKPYNLYTLEEKNAAGNAAAETARVGVNAYRSMKSSNVSGLDTFRYFTYTASTGVTSLSTARTPNDLNNNNVIYAHIFKLPAGDYAIGSTPGGTTSANLYYLAAQGQDLGNVDDIPIAAVGNVMEDVDFLTVQPTKAMFEGQTLSKANFQFKAKFKAGELGELRVGVHNVGSAPNIKSYLLITYSTQGFITKLTANDYGDSPNFYYGVINAEPSNCRDDEKDLVG